MQPALRIEIMSFTPGQIVYHANSPSRRGVIPGRTRKMGPVTAWEVVYSANDKTYIPANVLNAVEIAEDTRRIPTGVPSSIFTGIDSGATPLLWIR